MSRTRTPSSGPEANGRVEVLTRPAWRVTLGARAPRIVAGVLAGVLIVAGARTVIAGPPQPPPPPKAAPAVDQGAQTFAEGFVRAYLTWDPERPDLREAELAAYASSELDPAAGVEMSNTTQTVDWTAGVGSEVLDDRRQVVTVAARAGGRAWHLAVPVIRDARGYLAVAALPALVGPPPTARDERPAEEDDVADTALIAVAQRAVRNYLAGERQNLAADLDPEAVVSLPDSEARVDAIDGVTRSGRDRVAVAVTAVLDGVRMELRYELGVVKRERWYVRSIATDPRSQPAGSAR